MHLQDFLVSWIQVLGFLQQLSMINQYMHANAGEDLSNSINDNQDLSKAKKIALRKISSL
jgi:hypothetical protein